MVEMESAHSGKMKKRKGSQKAKSEKVRCKNLEGREIGGQLFKDTPKRKVNKRLLGKKAQKEENYEKQGRDQPPKLLAQHWLWYLGEQKRGINGTSEP